MKYLILSASFALTIGAAAQAHHSYAPFDMEHPVTVTGTVKEFKWTNPHSWLYLVVPTAQGGVEEWEIEGPAVAMMARNGWTSTTLKPGEKIHVILAPAKDGSKRGAFSRVDRENGQVLNTGRLAAE